MENHSGSEPEEERMDMDTDLISNLLKAFWFTVSYQRVDHSLKGATECWHLQKCTHTKPKYFQKLEQTYANYHLSENKTK